jgi:hypothetical protein
MIRNVLLMLSTDQPPDPVEEMQWHVRQCGRDGVTALATTRVLTGLTPGRSIVAFYGNQALANRYLGGGTFVEFVRFESDRGGRSPERVRCTAGGANPAPSEGSCCCGMCAWRRRERICPRSAAG